MTDHEWMQLIESDAQKACHELITVYGNLVYAIVLNKLKGIAARADIEDCVSDVFIEVLRCAESFAPENGTMKGYVSTIAKRTAIDAFRRLSYHQSRTQSIDEPGTVLPPAEDSPAEEAERRIATQQLWQMIRSLGEPDTSILVRQYFYGQTAKEIAKALSMTADAVQKRSVRARQKLRVLLASETDERSARTS